MTLLGKLVAVGIEYRKTHETDPAEVEIVPLPDEVATAAGEVVVNVCAFAKVIATAAAIAAEYTRMFAFPV